MGDFLVLNLMACDNGTGVGHPPRRSPNYDYEPLPSRTISPPCKLFLRVTNTIMEEFML